MSSVRKDRDGMVFGAGSALMLIETKLHAKERGARIVARLTGAAITSDGHDSIKPDPEGEAAGDAIVRAIELARRLRQSQRHRPAHLRLGTSESGVR